ncbi:MULTISPECIES: DEAD/DEAH box helicase [unclassified Streptococcus]|uniref:DEAD/DEAH box helicase n=1 Tax=unclassified Streptococcus TaxID=2608887 RepID=UPI001072B802|nr:MULTISPECIES: DEAD/DEAH box helicase [unclassified Streptococcus]MBF0787852.1 DEAD/DEAH box helicase [Streptococcus sp. 19428wC2_LYSM12]MCQ9211135.1 DEAD/DEAH box helicase [Streptococcus sp. B01]MCQ9214410.1 DEAD/DEAH box helicase [Streptococcus sp. O1]TFV05103.1 DNA/RNA helicase [Streptococcus sp. LYSM12]
MTDLANYYGRLFTYHQLTEEERMQATKLASQTADKACFRCSTIFDAKHCLPAGAIYCRECILLGRVRTDEDLYSFPQQAFPRQKSLKWQGQLTVWQQEISDILRQHLNARTATLVHAVTGAGKTEMIYQVVADVIDAGGAVCLASPRIDVCIELYRRLQEDFACPISLLHGAGEAYFRTPLVIATTHQLLKFYRAFDLVLIDEVDAFPYTDNPVLYRAVENAVKEDGVTMFLTATSTDKLEQKVRAGSLHRLRLPRRFHGNPLVVPQKVWLAHFENSLKKNKIVPKLLKKIANQQQTGFPLLLFLPEIQMGHHFAQLLEGNFPDESIGFVSSQTENRFEIVEQFRKKEISILITTTILERGITFPCIDVFVVNANHHLYTSSSLIQIAGRVGRSMERPTGEVLFFQDGTNHAIEKAIQEIRLMNEEAGYGNMSIMSANA